MLPSQNQAAFKGVPSTRSNFTPQQVGILEDCFNHESRPVRAKMEELALEAGLTLKNVQIWFQNRRARARKRDEPLSSTQRADKPNNVPQGPELVYQYKGYFRTNPSLADSLRPRNYAAQSEPIHSYTLPASYYRCDPPSLYPSSISTPRRIHPAPSNSQQAYIHLPHPHISPNNYERANYNYPNSSKASPSVTSHYLGPRPPNHMAKYHYPAHSM